MKELTDLDKLRVLVPHWIEHNIEHASEFLRWAESAEKAGHGDIAEEIRAAANCLEEANGKLSRVLKRIG